MDGAVPRPVAEAAQFDTSMRPLQESIEVYVGEDGEICIAHVDMSEDCSVAIPPEQVDVLIAWLKEKQAEAFQYRASADASH
jgi:hypothetical protein